VTESDRNNCGIRIRRRTARWDTGSVTAAEAMDLWAFAAGAANVIMQLSWPGLGYTVAESAVHTGSLLKHPWKRARTTLQYVAVILAPVFRDAMGLRWNDFAQHWFETLFLLVAFVNRFLPMFIREGGSYLLLADVRRRVRTHRALV
jgi:uncharacterized protein (DUF2236 family)